VSAFTTWWVSCVLRVNEWLSHRLGSSRYWMSWICWRCCFRATLYSQYSQLGANLTTHLQPLAAHGIGPIIGVSLTLRCIDVASFWSHVVLFMVALCNRADHYIFALWFLSYSSFFPRLISAVGDWMSTILPHMVWPLCEFRMHVWNLLHAARWKYRTQKNWHLGIIARLCRAISSQLRHVSTIGKKLVKQQYVLHMSPQYGELRPTSDWDWFGSLRHPCKFFTIGIARMCICVEGKR